MFYAVSLFTYVVKIRFLVVLSKNRAIEFLTTEWGSIRCDHYKGPLLLNMTLPC